MGSSGQLTDESKASLDAFLSAHGTGSTYILELQSAETVCMANSKMLRKLAIHHAQGRDRAGRCEPNAFSKLNRRRILANRHLTERGSGRIIRRSVSTR